jgi:hypothetical protein
MNDDLVIVPLPKNAREALALLKRCDFEEDGIAELGDNLVVIDNLDGSYTFSDDPDADEGPEEVTFKLSKVE